MAVATAGVMERSWKRSESRGSVDLGAAPCLQFRRSKCPPPPPPPSCCWVETSRRSVRSSPHLALAAAAAPRYRIAPSRHSACCARTSRLALTDSLPSLPHPSIIAGECPPSRALSATSSPPVSPSSAGQPNFAYEHLATQARSINSSTATPSFPAIAQATHSPVSYLREARLEEKPLPPYVPVTQSKASDSPRLFGIELKWIS